MNAWRAGEMPVGTLFSFAKEIGADRVELLDAFLYAPGTVRDHLPDKTIIDEFVRDVLEGMASTGVSVGAIAVTNDFNHDDPARLLVERNKIRLGISLAKQFEANVVRVFSGNPTSSDGVEMVRYRTIDALKDFAGQGAYLALENHGNVFATPGRLISILDPIKNPNVGICFDIGNFILADVNPVEALNQLPKPGLFHVKDFRKVENGPYRSANGTIYEGCRLGEGIVPIAECLKKFKERFGLHAIPIHLELECGDDGIEATRAGVKWLRALFESV